MFERRFQLRWLPLLAARVRSSSGYAPPHFHHGLIARITQPVEECGLGVWAVVLFLLLMAGCTAQEQRTVRARVQPRPGAPAQEVDMAIHEVPVDPPSVPAQDASLGDTDLVLGLIVEGQPMAYPIRYLATVEVLNDTVGTTALAPTW